MKKILFILMLSVLPVLYALPAHATVLWMGSEDIDFPNGSGEIGADGAGGRWRTNYARFSIYNYGGQPAVSNAFPGGAVTNAWLSFEWWSPDCNRANERAAGLGTVGTNYGIYVGNESNVSKLAIWKYDGTTWTELASSASGVLNCGMLVRIDMQIINYGASATVNAYLNGSNAATVTYTGDLTFGGANTSVNGVFIAADGYNNNSVSELFVDTDDTRQMLGLVTLYPNAAGDTSGTWTGGTYSTIAPSSVGLSPSSYIGTTATGDDFEANLSALPSTGVVNILGVKVNAWSATVAGAPQSLKVGVKTNGSISVPTAVTQSTGWQSTETYYANNPVTSAAWTSTDINNLQIDLQSAP